MKPRQVLLGMIVLASSMGFGLLPGVLPYGASIGQGARATCPTIPHNPVKFSVAYGTVKLNAVDAPIGSLVTAYSPRGDLVGCFAVTIPGYYGALAIYGEDTSVTPALPGMRAGESVMFKLNGITATGNPAFGWNNDQDFHRSDLTATSATSTPTVTRTPAATNTGSKTPTHTITPTPTGTITPGAPVTSTPTPTNTGSKTPTHTITPTPTGTITPGATVTSTPTPANTGSQTPSGTITPTPTITGSATPAHTSTITPTATGALMAHKLFLPAVQKAR